MEEFFEKFKEKLQEISFKVRTAYAKLVRRPLPKRPGEEGPSRDRGYEINLVPEVKMQMIKAQKMRNLVLFICIVVSSVAVGAVVILFGIKSGQDIAMHNQDSKLKLMSDKLNGYDEFEDLITIQDQLGRYSEILQKRAVVSRVFGALGVMLPQGSDEVKMSELKVTLDTDTINMEGQADAKVAPLIDYRVLEAFKKSVDLTKFDYGRYVDVDGKEIPTQCIVAADESGNAFRDGDSYYAWWDLKIPGCEATERSLNQSENDAEFHFSSTAEVETEEVEEVKQPDVNPMNPLEPSTTEPEVVMVEKPVRVKIWRTPQFDAWYQEGYMSTDGKIDGVEHFNSECYVYSGSVLGGGGVRWSSTNDCALAPKGLTISGSSNGRDESDNLVLRFTATVQFAEEYFSFKNKHMIAIGPMGQNVTDSFMQIGSMFTQEARACEADDTECLGNSENSGGNKNGQ